MISGLLLSRLLTVFQRSRSSLNLNNFQKIDKHFCSSKKKEKKVKVYESVEKFNFRCEYLHFFSFWVSIFYYPSFSGVKKYKYLCSCFVLWSPHWRNTKKGQLVLNYSCCNIFFSKNTIINSFIEVSIANLLLVQEYSIEESVVLCLASQSWYSEISKRMLWVFMFLNIQTQISKKLQVWYLASKSQSKALQLWNRIRSKHQ